MDRNAEMKWYMDQFSGSRERFYEIHMLPCLENAANARKRGFPCCTKIGKKKSKPSRSGHSF